MLKELLKNRKFNEIVRNGLEKEGVLDVILFGSIARGKEEPNDIDLIIIYAFKEDINCSYELRKKLEKSGFKVHISSNTYKGLFHPSFMAREGIIFEGHSFRLNRPLSSGFGFSSFMLFKYYLQGMGNSDRMRFYYALHGRRNEKGILKVFNCYKFSDKLIIVPVENTDKIAEFFSRRSIRFDKVPILIPQRLASKKFLDEHENEK